MTKRTGESFRWIWAALLLPLGCTGPVELLTPEAAAEADSVLPSENLTPFGAEARERDVSLAAASGPPCMQLGAPATTVHQALFDALNDYRRQNGLNPLIYSLRLEAAAEAQVQDLWQRAFFAHINPDGESPGDRALAAGFCHRYVGENLAAGQNSVPAVMTAWQNSPGHDANMLEPDYVYVGVAVSQDANGRLYWAQEFAFDLP
jgi:uncharacterized protein YkwD